MPEYWWSARQTCIELLHDISEDQFPSDNVPTAFKQLRPWIHHGWEMVLIAAELLRPDSPLTLEGYKAFSKNYSVQCQQSLDFWGWESTQLQEALDHVRHNALTTDKSSWLSRQSPLMVCPRLSGGWVYWARIPWSIPEGQSSCFQTQGGCWGPVSSSLFFMP